MMSKVTKEDTEHAQPQAPVGCGIMGRYPILSFLVFAFLGVAIGIGLSYWDPEDDSKYNIIKWIGLIGDLFIRSLKCVVLPFVFVNVIIAVIEMLDVGRAGSIGWKTVLLYLTTTVIASIIGIISIMMFQSLFNEGQFDDPLPSIVKIGCNDEGTFITEGENGGLTCSSDMNSNSEFIIDDLTKNFITTSGGVKGDITLSDNIYDGVSTKLITDNIVFAFSDTNFGGVVFCVIAFCVALRRVFDQRGGASKSFVLPFLKELNGVFMAIINWIITISLFAVFSLICSAIGGQDDLSSSFTNVAYLVVATLVGYLLHFLTVPVLLLYLVTKQNPFPYLKQMIPAQTMSFACASSAATIPVTMRWVLATGIIPKPVARFVFPLGTTVNMDGSAIYFPCACIWLAILNGITPNVGNYLLLVIISTIGSAGTAPVPSAGLVLIIAAYNTVFSTTGVPEGNSYIVAIDWFMDRLRTIMNVTGDTVVCRMIAHLCPMDGEELESVIKAANLDESLHGISKNIDSVEMIQEQGS